MEVTLCLVLLAPSEAFSSREGAIHLSDPGQTKATYFHGADLQKKEPLFPEPPPAPLESHLPFLPGFPTTASHCPCLVRHGKQHGGYNLENHPLHVGTASGCGAE